ncbi:MAG TPA: carbohydrate porin, partial [Alphaproteobacteria bacterium]|nr:carbohydrate porin [Alphaproteobacteria bacterium]
MTKRILSIAAMTAIATAGIGMSAAHAESSTKISGRIYADLSSISEKVDGVKTSKDGFGFDVKRFYLGVDHGFDDIFHVAVTTDFTYSSA